MEKAQAESKCIPFRDGLFVLECGWSGYLLGNRCKVCGITYFPRRKLCVECFKRDALDDVRLCNEGVLHTFTVVYRSTPKFNTPYILGFVDLDVDKIRIFASIRNCQEDQLKIGMRMKVAFGVVERKTENGGNERVVGYWFETEREVSFKGTA